MNIKEHSIFDCDHPCPRCGSNWYKFMGQQDNKNGYLYKCESCGHTIIALNMTDESYNKINNMEDGQSIILANGNLYIGCYPTSVSL